ncbi:general stress protein CsbD [Caballeronia megalochromosomata]|nr:general stress protein CsbD [Caballeronia megalochromosomata]
MNKDQVKGTAEKEKEKLNEGVDEMTGDTVQQVKGQVQQGAGEARKQYGDAKEEVKRSRP